MSRTYLDYLDVDSSSLLGLNENVSVTLQQLHSFEGGSKMKMTRWKWFRDWGWSGVKMKKKLGNVFFSFQFFGMSRKVFGRLTRTLGQKSFIERQQKKEEVLAARYRIWMLNSSTPLQTRCVHTQTVSRRRGVSRRTKNIWKELGVSFKLLFFWGGGGEFSPNFVRFTKE